MATLAPEPGISPVVEALIAALGDAAVLHDAASRDYYANDVFWQPGIVPLAIVSPDSEEGVAAAARICSEHDAPMIPRGGGMSYTQGYLPSRGGAVVFDMRRMNRVIEIDTASRFVTVETGCTWAALAEALASHGMRSGYWGPLSGINATIGGALSQNSAFFGSAKAGTLADSVIGLKLVLADGRSVTTGSASMQGVRPFTREGGPDMTGMFLGDSGAFGIKTQATLRLAPAPGAIDYLSYGFATMAQMAAMQVELAEQQLVSEGFGLDRTKVEHSASVNKITDGIRALANVATSAKSLFKGARDAIGIAAAGTAFLKEHNFTLHLVLEGRNAQELATSMAMARKIGARHGVEIENSIPKVMRAKPFGPVRGMLGRDGERWVPIHGVFPLGEAQRVVAANDAYFAEQAEFMAQHGIILSVMTMTVGSEFFIEPAFYWRDEITPLHRKSVGEDIVAPWLSHPAAPETRAAVVKLRQGTQRVYAELGGINWQIARDYPFAERVQPETWSYLKDIKASVDPRDLMNPGALGL